MNHNLKICREGNDKLQIRQKVAIINDKANFESYNYCNRDNNFCCPRPSNGRMNENE